ncbi:ATP-dependent nuclease [Metallosphaera hakonensis]|uniref:ATPase n=1 Tax=Metallosphaera hakonensis JCM 8857 = DSM 7519 TaxID=1293036 RepID=A0A2U9IX30_9CREN|nr:ATP/GTP-binding protein [Metallosphaera hakonensis]AWS00639.1 AAA family ATPase [Metallosphaera hakonensis JCM 8857 = DSM 7519]
MRLAEFYTNNFRSLESVDLRDIGGFNVIVGFNGYGKTNLLTAIYLYIKNLSAGLEKRSIEDKNQEYLLMWNGYDTSRPILLGGRLQFSEKEVEKVIGKSMNMNIDIINKLRYINGYLEWDLDLIRVNGSVPSKDEIDQSRKLLDYAAGQVEYVPIFDQSYFDDVLNRIVGLNRSPINLRKYWYDFANLVSNTIPEVKGIEIWDSKKLVLNVYNLPIYIDLAASGFQRIILILFVIWLSGNKILLIEEPEVNMHPIMQHKMARLLKSWTESDILQVFMTTHSPFIVSSEVDNFIVLRRGQTASKAINFQPNEDVKSAFSILNVNISDLMFNKTIIISSDLAEPNVILNWLKKLNVNPEYNGIVIYTVRNELELQTWLKLRNLLKLEMLFLGLCDKIDSELRDLCLPLNREVESFYSKSGMLEALKRMGIYPDDKEMKDLSREDNARWLVNVLKRRGLDYSTMRSSIGDIISRIDSIEIPKEMEILVNKIKTAQVI